MDGGNNSGVKSRPKLGRLRPTAMGAAAASVALEESAGSTFRFPLSGEARILRWGGEGMKRSSTLDRLIEPVVRTFTPEVARALVGLRADPELQARMDELA